MAKNKFKYINNFPFIIMVVVALILIILVNIYLSVHPDKVVSFNANFVSSGDMTYNLSNKNLDDDKYDINAVQVYNGDYVYKQLDSYYVGEKEKKEIDISYPAYSSDGLTLYTLNEDIKLINNNFDEVDGYSGLSINYGLLYNVGDEEPIDNESYMFIDLKNSILINTISMSIITPNKEYEITVNSPVYFHPEYINYYSFDGEKFKYNVIDDIYYDSIIKIGDYTLTYEEFLLNLDLIKPSLNFKEEVKNENQEQSNNNGITSPENNVEYIKPTVKFDSFNSSAYYIKSTIEVIDTSNVITQYPVFEIYDENEKLVLRKKIFDSKEFYIKGLLPNQKYHVIGKFEYLNELGLNIENKFYDDYILTKTIDSLDPIKISSKVGNRYEDKIEIKEVEILNLDNEALSGVTRISIDLGDNEFNLSYTKMKELLAGKKINISTEKKLESNTIYDYEIKFYDKANNQIKLDGIYSGTVQTLKKEPTIKINSIVDGTNVDFDISLTNEDNVDIREYKYILSDYSNNNIKNGNLNIEEKQELSFDHLYYNTNYVLQVIVKYVSDGNEVKELIEEHHFTIGNMGALNIHYELRTEKEDQTGIENQLLTSNSFDADVYFGNNAVFERKDVKIQIYLADKNGKDILNNNNELMYLQEYTNSDLQKYKLSNYKFLELETFTNLKSNTEYQIKVKVIVNNLEIINSLEPNIKTLTQDASIEVEKNVLYGNNLDVLLKVNDVDKKIDNNELSIEIYKGIYNTMDSVKEKRIDHSVKPILYDEEGNGFINIKLDNAQEDSYTIVVSAYPYNSKNVRKVLKKITTSKNIKSRLEIYQQKVDNNKTTTEINLSYYKESQTAQFDLIDCVGSNCSILNATIIDQANNMLKEYKTKVDKRISIESYKNEKHKLYFALNKGNANQNTNVNLDDYYLLSEIEFETGVEINNISTEEDFYNITTNSKNPKNYVVTDDLYFINNNSDRKLKDFYGIIDFQGYDINLYKSNNLKATLFNTLASGSILRNFNVNYEIGFEGVDSAWHGILSTNKGTIENFIINLSYKKDANNNVINTGARNTKLGIVCSSNQGTIDRFVFYLTNSISVYGATGLVTYQNTQSGTISNGYVAGLSSNYKVFVYDTNSLYGTFAYKSSGVISNVYNIVDVISLEEAPAPIATIVYESDANSTTRNTLSIATSSKKNENGPNIYSPSLKAKLSNNFYYDSENSTFSNKYNKNINKTVLKNTGVLEVLLNNNELIESEKAFSIISRYYPTVKMNQFMEGKQTLLPIIFNDADAIIDVISTEVIEVNKEEGTAKIGVYISNPNAYKIESIVPEKGISSTTIEQVYYPDTQVTYLTSNIKLEKNGLAKSVYEINELYYFNENNIQTKKVYTNNKPRIEVVMYRPVSDYDTLISALDNNENIYLTANINSNGSEKLPDKNLKYTSLFDGQNHTLNLNGYKKNEKKWDETKKTYINRGYFINSLTSEIKNLQIYVDIDSTKQNVLGFIRAASYANLENIDISNSRANISYTSGSSIIFGMLVGDADYTNLNKISLNNSSIIINDQGNSKNHSIEVGGIIGENFGYGITNSYVYDTYFDVKTNTIGITRLGGIIGYTYAMGMPLKNLYSEATINTNLSNVGGLAGILHYNSYLSNSYSAAKISSTGKNVGGLVGSFSYLVNKYLNNNMFIGNIDNLNSNPNYSQIIVMDPSYSQLANIENNYVIKPENINYPITNNYKEFDVNNTFDIRVEGNSYYYPTLKESSFVTQQIGNKIISTENLFDYYVEYFDADNKLVANEVATYANLYIKGDYTNSKINSINSELLIDSDKTFIDGYTKIKIQPKNYVSSYEIGIDGQKKLLIIDFYRQIKEAKDWIDISTEFYENINLLNDLDFSSITDKSKIYNKKINNFNGNNKKISNLVLNESLIYSLKGEMKKINFEEIEFSYSNNTNASTIYDMGIIKYNLGEIIDTNFTNITLTDESNKIEEFGIVAYNKGDISNVQLKNITVTGGKNYVGGLVGYSNMDYKYNFKPKNITNIIARDITVSSTGNNVGGIVGRELNTINSTEIYDFKISGKSYVGGIAGRGNVQSSIADVCNDSFAICKDDILNDKNNYMKQNSIYVTGDYIGGISGTGTGSNNTVKNLKISNSQSVLSNYVGGVFGSATSTLGNFKVENLLIGEFDENSKVVNKMNADSVGGVAGYINGVHNSYVRNSIISGNSNVGGLFGITNINGVGVTKYNTVSKTDIYATGNNVGGLIGSYNTKGSDIGYLSVENNVILGSNDSINEISGNSYVGGIIGYLNNNTTAMQNFKFEYNFVENYQISAKDKNFTSGGLIGTIYQTPLSNNIKFNKSIYYGNIFKERYGIGYIENVNTNSPAYTSAITPYDVSRLSNFKYYVTEISDSNIHINGDLKDYATPASSNPNIVVIDGYFPYLSNYIYTEDLVELPNGINNNARVMMFARRRVPEYTKPIDVKYDIYVSDINKVNIEFSNVDENISFYYEIGDYISDIIQLDKRTYTLTYDFKNPINLYLTNGETMENKSFEAKDLAKKISVINGTTYYINNGILNSETNVVTGNFVNLYNNQALSNNGQIYNIINKSTTSGLIDYNILEHSKPLYKFNYNSKNIETYYNYSIVDGKIKEYQIFVNKNKLSIIDNSIDNKKDSVLIDFYNNKDIEIVLKNGVLYSLKDAIKNPTDMMNEGIKDIYYDFNSNFTLLVLLYESGEVYTFDYITGNKIYSNRYDSNMNLFEYIKSKMSTSSSLNSIETISSGNEYKEIKKLEDKLEINSIEDATNKIYQTNNLISKDKKYITAYNSVTNDYDIYVEEDLLNEDEVISENNKIYKDYQLVQFYKGLTNKNQNKSTNGILIFTATILSILTILYILVKRKKIKVVR